MVLFLLVISNGDGGIVGNGGSVGGDIGDEQQWLVLLLCYWWCNQ